MSVPPSSQESSDFVQAKKYGEDLVKLFAIEKAKRIKLEISNQKLQAIFSTNPDGLIVLDEALNIEEANPAFWSLIERQNPGATVPLKQVLSHPRLLATLEGDSAAGQTSRKIEAEVQISDRVTRNLLINAVPLAASDQRGWVLSISDLTERKRLESLKSEFINIAAHELRTPLAAILGFSQVLRENMQEENSDELSIHLVDTILSSSNRLKDIIDELIEFADIRYQNDGKGNTVFNLVTLVEQNIVQIEALAFKKKLTIETAFSSPQIEITGNPDIIKEVLKHLTENAVQFNKPGGKIFFRVLEIDNQIQIDIEDTGIGIPQTEIHKIFDKFYQVEEHLTRSVGGLGLGLAIAQRGIQLYGGKISVTSKLNEGSCFTITFPKTSTALSMNSEGIRDSYQQTLVYGRDLAKAVSAEKTLSVKVKKYEQLYRALRAAINAGAPTEEITALLDQIPAEDNL